MRSLTRLRALPAVLFLPILLGMGINGGKDIIQPAVDLSATVVDRDGTSIDVSRLNIAGRVDLEGQLGRGRLRVSFEDMASIDFKPESRTRTAVTIHMRNGKDVELAVRGSLTFYGRTPVGLYEVRARDLTRIDFKQ